MEEETLLQAHCDPSSLLSNSSPKSPMTSPRYLDICDTFILQTPKSARGEKGPQLPVLQGDHVHQP